ncbi:MAG TPA: pseudaminic acid cytidylyltransferase [Lentisphaeria bacterium]|nr:MAG: pseudaminic acid cytidylyltransferase [Lentisphaerae bacterium GWF2_49_21]HBC87165.1 pseudaminic acid cytidylyltransferase [Lentisphaeria bacterium]
MNGKTGNQNTSNIAIIPARGGSKRIPGKNKKVFCGKPMISYSIAAAKASGIFNRIIVTTDSQDIASMATGYGAEVPFMRPPELSDDHASTDAVVLHSLDWINANWGQADYICCIYSTAPFVRPEYLKAGLEILVREKATSAFSVTSFPYPIFRALKIETDGRLKMFWPEHRMTRSQDLSEAYHDAGQFYWADARKYAAERKLFSSDAVPVVLPRKLVQDIDTPEDWERAEAMYKVLFGQEK